jgi:PAS domain-containing protein
MTDVDPLDLLATIREGLLVLEPDLTVRFANRSFCNTFGVAPEDTVGRKLYESPSRAPAAPTLTSASRERLAPVAGP